MHRRGQYELARPGVRRAGAVLAGVGLAVLAVGYAVALWRIPGWMGLNGEGGDAKDRHNARLLVVSAGGAVVVAISLLYTARNYRLSHRGQVTDRFTKALERLSSTDIDARLGGIHALEHVAADSRPHHDDVVEVLEAFVRRRAPTARRDDGGPTLGRPRPLPDQPEADVQATLTALATRPHRPERRTLDLSRLHLANARLRDADLRHADLQGADLRDADLLRANMRDAILWRTNLRRANLSRASLRDAILWQADLRRASLQNASLQDTNLRGADLQNADLRNASLRGADLRGVDLQNANLRYASLQNTDLRDAILRDASLRDAGLRGASLRDADLRGADLQDANLRYASLQKADLRGADLRGVDMRNIGGIAEAKVRAMARVDERTRFS
ncbi:pentapeptide repeat-containing protein [Actinomadura fibrosa]|uniref:pentapeptide repeat-containing protein n=1 Tax=Actinomadura fibrosa TaxID=111802 RepID=UPI001A955419|nr:pentapeptide repeat-containing protein [Actinomadura fibrosa]